MLNCDFGVQSDGTLSGDISTACVAVMHSLRKLNVGAELWLGEQDSIDAAHRLFAKPEPAAASLVKIVKQFGLAGVNFDLEPHTSTPSDAVAYARFLRAIRPSINAAGARLTVDAALWTPMIAKMGEYEAAVDRILYMHTYFAGSLEEWLEYLQPGLDRLPREKLGAGLAVFHDPRTAGWADTAAAATQRLCWLANASVPEVAMFRILHDKTRTWPDPFWLPPLRDFASGTPCDPGPVPSGGCPSGWIGPGSAGCCVQRHTPSCGEVCAKAECRHTHGWWWKPEDYHHHPYTCCPPNGTAPRPTTSSDSARASTNATAELPDVLTFVNGSAVASLLEWAARRRELKQLLQRHILGSMPDEQPELRSATLLNVSTSATLCGQYVRLAWLANRTDLAFDVELVWRCDRSKAALPAFLTQLNHRGWAMAAAQRGYLALVYPGGDTRDAAPLFRKAYPAATFRLIAARAFVASRAIDFLLSKHIALLGAPQVNASRVTISGHSRNGKQSLVAAAFDERISAVVGSSPGTPISAPIRYSSPDYNGEPTLFDTVKRDWFLESLYNYYGAENRVPADGHMVLALIAPRHALVATADSDASGDVTFAVERGIAAALPAYRLVGAPSALRMRYRPARHHGALDVQSYFDWFDMAAGLADEPPGAHFYPPHSLHEFHWQAWRAATPPPPPPPPPSSPLAERVHWLLGGASALATGATGGLHGGSHYCENGNVGTAYDFAAAQMGLDTLPKCHNPGCKYKVVRHALSFGAYVTANILLPDGLAGPLPVVIFLHGHSYHYGVSGAYGLLAGHTHGGLLEAIAARGVAVLIWDQVGMGRRQHVDGAPLFYRRHPGGSRLGAMVGEVQAALQFIHCASDNATAECSDGELHDGVYPKLELPKLDAARTCLLGYSLGAVIALHAAALVATDARPVAGVAAFAGWTPMRTGGGGVATGGLRALYETHALMPRLGLFEGSAHAVPYDYDELIASLAPRHLLLHAPRRDRFAVADDVAAALSHVNASWAAKGAPPSRLEMHTPDAPSDMRDAEIRIAVSWVERVLLGDSGI